MPTKLMDGVQQQKFEGFRFVPMGIRVVRPRNATRRGVLGGHERDDHLM